MKNLKFQFKVIDCKKFTKTGLPMLLNKKHKLTKIQFLKILTNKYNKNNKQINNNKK